MFKVMINSGVEPFETADEEEFATGDGVVFGFAADKLMYSDRTPLEEYKLISPNLELEVNAPGSFTFTIPPCNNEYDSIEPMNTRVKIYQDGYVEPIFEGRVISIDTDFYGQKNVTCEGELAYLYDTTVPNHIQTFSSIRTLLSYVLRNHNEKSPDYKHFVLGAVTVNDPDIGNSPTGFSFESTWDIIAKLIELYGGFVRIVKQDGVRKLEYRQSVDELPFCEQEITFGKNLLDHTTNFEVTELCTVLIPLGATLNEIEGATGSSGDAMEELKKNQRLTIESVNNGSPYLVAREAYDTFGHIEKTIVFSDCKDAATLKKYGELYLNELQFAEMSIDVSAIDLSYTNRKELPEV